MRFVKMHGAGNDYVYVNGFEERVADPAALAQVISDRHFGVGSDGLILVLPPEADGEVRMRMFNADGSESEMCGNGVRCVAKFARDRGLAKTDTVRVETMAGLREIRLFRDPSTVSGQGRIVRGSVVMGRPILEPAEIPVRAPGLKGGRVVDLPIKVGLKKVGATYVAKVGMVGVLGLFGPKKLRATCVSMGNPHAVFYVDDAAAWPLETMGPKIERHKFFPERINVHIVQIVSPSEVIARTWERGTGITLSCGTGASAMCVAGVLSGRTGRKLLAHLPGGDLEMEWPANDAPVTLIGPVEEVFTGEWPDR